MLWVDTEEEAYIAHAGADVDLDVTLEIEDLAYWRTMAEAIASLDGFAVQYSR